MFEKHGSKGVHAFLYWVSITLPPNENAWPPLNHLRPLNLDCSSGLAIPGSNGINLDE